MDITKILPVPKSGWSIISPKINIVKTKIGKIPFKDLCVFNRTIKYYYDNSAPSLEWIDEFFNGKNQIYVNYKVPVKGYSKLFEMRLPSNRRVLYVPGTDCYFFYEKAW